MILRLILRVNIFWVYVRYLQALFGTFLFKSFVKTLIRIFIMGYVRTRH